MVCLREVGDRNKICPLQRWGGEEIHVWSHLLLGLWADGGGGGKHPVKFFCLFFQRRLGSHSRKVEWLFWYRGDMYP